MSYTYSHLEDYVTNTYQQLQINSPSQLNLYFIADQLNIGLYPINDRSQALRFEGRDYIFLNNSLSAHERWEVFAHEIKSCSLARRQSGKDAAAFCGLSGMASRIICAPFLYTNFYASTAKVV